METTPTQNGYQGSISLTITITTIIRMGQYISTEHDIHSNVCDSEVPPSTAFI